MKTAKARLDALSRRRTEYETNIASFQNYIANDLKPVIDNLQMNQVYTICDVVEPNKAAFKFPRAFNSVPKVMPIVNKFKIEFDKNVVSFQKFILDHKSITNEEIIFKNEDLKENLEIPICMLILESKGDAK